MTRVLCVVNALWAALLACPLLLSPVAAEAVADVGHLIAHLYDHGHTYLAGPGSAPLRPGHQHPPTPGPSDDIAGSSGHAHLLRAVFHGGHLPRPLVSLGPEPRVIARVAMGRVASLPTLLSLAMKLNV